MSFSAVSNTVPSEPVFAPTSWAIFEREIIVRYIERYGKDPINGVTLTIEQLIRVYHSSVPKAIDDIVMADFTSGEYLYQELSDKLLQMRRQTIVQGQLFQKVQIQLNRIMYQQELICMDMDRLRANLPELKAKLIPNGGASHAADSTGIDVPKKRAHVDSRTILKRRKQ